MAHRLAHADPVILDELSHLRFSQSDGTLPFHLLTKLYEKTSVVITTSLRVAEWAAVFGDPRLAPAPLGRLTHHCHIIDCHIIEAGNESYRFNGVRPNREGSPELENHSLPGPHCSTFGRVNIQCKTQVKIRRKSTRRSRRVRRDAERQGLREDDGHFGCICALVPGDIPDMHNAGSTMGGGIREEPSLRPPTSGIPRHRSRPAMSSLRGGTAFPLTTRRYWRGHGQPAAALDNSATSAECLQRASSNGIGG